MAGPMMQLAAEQLATELADYSPHDHNWVFLAATLAGAAVDMAALASVTILANERGMESSVPLKTLNIATANFSVLGDVAYHHSAVQGVGFVPAMFDGTWPEYAGGHPLSFDDAQQFKEWLAERASHMLHRQFNQKEATDGR